MAELKLKIVPDLTDLKRQLNALNVPINATGGIGGGGKEQKEQTKELKGIGAGVFAGNLALKAISLFTEGLNFLLEPILKLIKILVLIIFLPLFPLLKFFLRSFTDFIKFFRFGQKKLEGRLEPLGPELGGLVAFALTLATGFLLPLLEGLIGIIESLDWDKIIETFTNIFVGAIDIASAIIVGILGFLAALDWNEIIDALVNGLASVIGVGGDVLKTIFNALPKPLKDAWGLVISAIENGKNLIFGPDGKTGVWGSLKGAIETAKGLLFGPEGVWNKIVSALEKTKTSLLDVWGRIIIGLGSILTDLEPWINFFAGMGFTRGSADDERRFIPLIKSAKDERGDFLMRPGQAPVSFSPSDTIVGFKGNGGGLGGGVNYSPTFHISADVDARALKKALEEHDRAFLTRLRAFGTLGGRSLNV